MGGSQTIQADMADVLKIMTSTISQSIVGNSTKYNSANIIVQTNTNSKNCKNIDKQKSDTTYIVNSSVLADELTYQKTVLNIIQELTDAQSNKASGGMLSGPQSDKIYAMILDIITTKLTSQTMVTIGENATNISVNVQHCTGSSGGVNYILATQKNMLEYYNQLYSKNATIQSVAADISNYISGTQANKKTGFLVTLMRMIAVIIIGVIVLAIVIVGAYLITLKGG